MANMDVAMTLDEAVAEVLGLLTGLDLTYSADYDRYRAVARQLNRALRAHALEKDWSYYSSVETIGTAVAGVREYSMRASVRPRLITGDNVRLVDHRGTVRVWAYFLPREALDAQGGQRGLWASYTRTSLRFSRPLTANENGLGIQVPVMREPRMFDLPVPPENPDDPIEEIPEEVRNQLVDYDYPDVVILKAAYYVAQSDPMWQPRVQTLEAQYKDLMYQLSERDEKNTDSPFLNDFFVPISSSIYGPDLMSHPHPHADDRRF